MREIDIDDYRVSFEHRKMKTDRQSYKLGIENSYTLARIFFFYFLHRYVNQLLL